MTNLTIAERRRDDVAILDLSGPIRLGAGSAELRQALRKLAESGAANVLLNLAGVSYIDSSGLGELVGGYTTIHRAGGDLKLVNLSPKVHELMTMTKLLTVFDVFENETEAIKDFGVVTEKQAFAASLMNAEEK